MTALSDALTAAQRSALAALYDAVQDARSDRSEWTDGDAADDAAEAFRWGYGGEPTRLEGDDE